MLPPAKDSPARPRAMRRGTVGDILSIYLDAQIDVIVAKSPDLKPRSRQAGKAIHGGRIAIRRLRSTLRTWADCFDAAEAAELDEELRWFAGLQGPVRDADVLGVRMSGLLDELPPSDVLAGSKKLIMEVLATQRSTGWLELTAALESERYRTLIMTLDRWRGSAPFAVPAEQSSTEIGRYLKRSAKKLQRRLARAVDQIESAGADEAWHRARKAAKAYRYAGELVALSGHSKAEAAITEGRRLHATLGEQQDCVVGAEFLRRLCLDPDLDVGLPAFTLGILYAQEKQRAAKIRRNLAATTLS